ncbi:DUF2059 domain-containing protein [Sphingomonas psychrotolerans]|uniref:DUF2059 domain-containing protein n=1 Tax=Sphingomonas psychrotolerans TaxID=1327635 RepID=A0A2K8MGK2_9SPHN|nr:hypothetical protein [Sphingomonas psychrotolerans]ATY32997.1 hypothetical protein CVN68_14345 [Sphingomonas psychrotolerans]
MTPEHQRHAREGMHRRELGGEACYIGMVAAPDRQALRRVAKGLLAGIILAPALPHAVPARAAPQVVAADPARLTTAEKVVAKLVPQGIYLRIMRDAFPQMMDAMIARMSGMTAADLDEKDKSGKTLEQLAAEKDPAFRERMTIMTRVMGEEMGKVMDKLEPRVRAAVGKAFARRFTLQQLSDMDVFFATPSGAAFAKDYLLTFMDPEMLQEMSASMPEMMRAMPEIMKRVEKETAHLPPPPKSEGDTDTEVETKQ